MSTREQQPGSAKVLNVMIEAAAGASLEVRPYWPGVGNQHFNPTADQAVEQKAEGIGNFVTAADYASGKRITRVFASYPELNGIASRTEESAPNTFFDGTPWWNIDEIDGTANFKRGSDHFGISIGYHDSDNIPRLGVLAFPASDEIIHASHGAEDMPDSVVLLRGLRPAADLVARNAQLPVDPELGDIMVAYDLGYSDKVAQIKSGALKMAEEVSALKSYHSSSYSLGQVAVGNLDAFFTKHPTIFDIGASTAVIEGIGGKVTDMQGNPIDWTASERSFLAARTPQIHARILEKLNA